MPARTSVSFSVACDADADPAVVIVPFVDGVSLINLVVAFEMEHSFKPCGGYGGLAPEWFNFGPLDRYLLGQHDDGRLVGAAAIYLLGCECGEIGCWPLQCHVQVTDHQVAWTHFSQPHRPERDYSTFGPFEFNASQYREAITLLQSDLVLHQPG